MLVLFSPIFVAHTVTIFGYNFGAPLIEVTDKNSPSLISLNTVSQASWASYSVNKGWFSGSKSRLLKNKLPANDASLLVHELIPFLASLGVQNIIWIFSNLRVSTF